MKDILKKLREGEITEEEAEREILRRLSGEVEGKAVLDLFRDFRTAVPEVVLGEGKTLEEMGAICLRFLLSRGEVALTRVGEEEVERLKELFEEALEGFERRFNLRYNPRGRVLTVRRLDLAPEALGNVILVTAGTSDIPVAEEARTLLEFYGARAETFYDVGIAGVHRLRPVVEAVERGGYQVALVFAGREGALPTLLSALISIPVIGVPVSSGYGHGGGGEAALSTMLQSCSPIAVVNIDSGYTAAMVAIKILKASRGGVGNVKK
ncbi:MAG: nickel pincer cofactor biosynthesis protein LarB [Thermoplasmata archaeon]|nr:MAG: nickel pincer cofactor biosynthesis protein LarB [Thermoplasmata archaeon]